MRKRLIFSILFFLVIGFSAIGLTRLRLETNILEVLPKNLASVQALKVSQKYFDNDQQVVLLLESHGDEIQEEDVAELATLLREKLKPAKVLHKSELEEDPQAAASALASLWCSAPAEDLEKMRARLLDPAALVAHLDEVKRQVSGSFDQQQSTMAAYDPLGFLQHPAVQQIMGSEFSFQSGDGKSQIILIANPNPGNGYKEQAAWLEEIRNAVKSWPELEKLGLTFRLTGGPVFNAEIGSGMEKDMSGTITLTSILIASLFLLVQRDIRQFLLILVLLAITFIVTLGLGGWIYGTLNLVSIGFAAILLGLAIDYPVVVARGSVGRTFTASSLRRDMFPNIFWAAVTTGIVFGALTLSTFSGVRELGGLLVIGLTAGAVATLSLTPIFLERFPCKDSGSLTKPTFLKARAAMRVSLLCLLVAGGIFAFKGGPKVSFSFNMVDPKVSEAAATFETIQAQFPAWSENNLQMVASARSWDQLREVATAAQGKLRKAQDAGLLANFQWPVGMIPDNQAMAANRETLAKITASRGAILETLKANGFSESGVALDSMILDSLAGPPGADGLGEFAKHFLSVSGDGNYYLSGRTKVAGVLNDGNLAALAPLQDADFHITGWPVLKADLLPSVQKDFYWIFLPTAALLLLSLLAVFKSLKDAAIATILLLAAGALLNAFAVALDLPWNFLSGLAIPLLVNSGVDYSIHLIFALRRFDGDLAKTWNGAGKAVCFCGLSTVIGFGSLMFASNQMLRSMGIMCSLAVLLTMLLSVLIVPGFWKWARR